MLSNATLKRIDAPPTADAASDPTWSNGAAIDPGLDCFLDGITATQRIVLEGAIAEATAVAYLSPWGVPLGMILLRGGRVVIARKAIPGGMPGDVSDRVYRIVKADVHSAFGCTDHWELFLRAEVP